MIRLPAVLSSLVASLALLPAGASEPAGKPEHVVDSRVEVSVPGLLHRADPLQLDLPGGGQPGPVTGDSPAPVPLDSAGPRPALFGSRTGSAREKALAENGGTRESEAVVARGLRWIVKQQSPDGRWRMDGQFKHPGAANDIAGTAFGLLPLLGAGKTHVAKDNPDHRVIEKGLFFLMRQQNRKTGEFPGGMYGQALATMALCEAYGLTQDPVLRRPAQLAVNYIVYAQHDAGGWRYGPRQAGDTSVTGWQVQALHTARSAGLEVPDATFKKVQRYLDACEGPDMGYGYTGPDSTPTMSAVGLLCRQLLSGWGPRNPRLLKGVRRHILTLPPEERTKNAYFDYYATRVMLNVGGESWQGWNLKMRDLLIRTQEKGDGPEAGSWSPVGDVHGEVGGRLMITSLHLLTLEVYYRRLPPHSPADGKTDSD